MTIRSTLGLVIALATVASATLADETTTPQTAQKPAAVVKPKARGDDMICKASEETGTRLGAKRVCYTRDQWAQINSQTYAAVNHMQEQSIAPK